MQTSGISLLCTKILPLFTALLLVSTSLFTSSASAQDEEPLTLAGTVALVTGSTDGLGREVALRLGALGAHVLVHGRNEERGAEVVAEINDGLGSAEFYQADFASLENVRALASRVIEEQPRLNLLINNAGIGSGFAGGERTVSEDGYEMIFQVNHLAHYLLTDLLLPTIRFSAPARIINVASGAQRPIDFDDIMMENSFDSRAAYAQSKLAQILHAFHVSELLEEDGVEITFNALHPATMMDTTMVAQMPGPARTTVDEGATAVMNLAISPELEGRSGLYFSGLNEAEAHEQAYDAEALRRFDALSRQLVDLPVIPEPTVLPD